MLKTIIITLVVFGTTTLMSTYYFGYSRAGNSYISKQRKKRRSIRPGVGYYGRYGYGRRGGFRGGK